MHYLSQDLAWAIDGLPPLAKPHFLAAMLAAGEEHAPVLAEYPQARHEDPEAYYLGLRGIGALDEDLHDLLFAHSFRELACGAWLAALAPQPSYRPHLLEARALDALPRPTVPLRRAPAPSLQQRLREEDQRILELYRREGSAAALAAMSGSATAFYRMDYPAWHRLGCPGLEEFLAGQGGRDA
ncbi:hypothetical protein [Lysobacter sp. 1R34A]|uniref:hypothetical protein n=1 Tax=Lysobacter sp. 1R34A TaxID=3445786 RepID=UPI003EEDCABA